MKCEEAAEFVSALCDGQTIPPAAAQHIGACQACHARLKEYVEMGAELRRIASLESLGQVRTLHWDKTQRTTQNWWQKGWETMRIPRFAFALLVVAAVALGSSLTMLKVRAHEQGKVLLLKAKSPGATMECALSLEDLKEANCGETAEVGAGILNRSFRIISKDGDRIELGVRAEFRAAGAGPHTTLFEEVADLPEARYQFEPGKQLEVDVAGSGTMVITGELMDHEPVFVTEEGEQLDPKVDELRVASPVLLHDKKVLFDFEGGSAFAAKGEAIEMYVPGKGLYRLSLSSMEGAVEGRINLNRISFELNGQPYTFLTGVPVARGKQIWVLLDPNFKPLGGAGEEGFIGVNNSLPKTPPKN